MGGKTLEKVKQNIVDVKHLAENDELIWYVLYLNKEFWKIIKVNKAMYFI